MPFFGFCIAFADRFSPCSKQAVALVTIEGLGCALCPVHLFEHLAEQVGIIATSVRSAFRIHEESLTNVLVQPWKSAYPTATPHIKAAMEACKVGDVALATTKLQEARVAIEAEVAKL